MAEAIEVCKSWLKNASPDGDFTMGATEIIMRSDEQSTDSHEKDSGSDEDYTNLDEDDADFEDELPEAIEAFPYTKDQILHAVDGIFDDWEFLDAVMKKYGHIVERRWSKKTGKKREAFLLEVWPEMPTSHRPDYKALRHGWSGPRHR